MAKVSVPSSPFEELLGPAAHRGVGVGIVALDIARQVGRLLGEIGERQLPRILLDRRQLGRQAEMFQPDGAGRTPAACGRAVELGDGDRVAERVVDPAHLGGGVDGQAGIEQAQMATVRNLMMVGPHLAGRHHALGHALHSIP